MAEIRHQIRINATPDQVYAALATRIGLQNWWTADTKIDEEVGGEAEFGFDRRQMVFRMIIEKLEPAVRVVWTCNGDHPEWTGTILTWNIAREDDATVLRFTHGGWKTVSEFCATCNSTWGELLYRLKDYVEGHNPGPHWKE